jgi:aminopeptidase I
MTRHPLRKAASNADLYSDPSPPHPHPLRHAQSTLSRAHTTAAQSQIYRADIDIVRASTGRRPFPRPLPNREGVRNRHSVASPYAKLIDVDEDDSPGEIRQQPPPVPPKILEEAVKEEPWANAAKVAREGRFNPWQQIPLRSKEGPEKYTKPFIDFMTNNPTVFHAVDAVAKDLEKDGYKKLSERDAWDLQAGGKYYLTRNGTSLIAFAIGSNYKVGNGAAIVAGHIDALTAKLKPISKLRNKAGYVQLGVAPYAGALSDTWWDRDLGIGGRVLVKENGKTVTKLVKLDWPIARIPTLAPHFGAAANGPFNKETQMVPIVGLDNSDFGSSSAERDGEWKGSVLGGARTFAATQPERLVKAICGEMGVTDCKSQSPH